MQTTSYNFIAICTHTLHTYSTVYIFAKTSKNETVELRESMRWANFWDAYCEITQKFRATI